MLGTQTAPAVVPCEEHFDDQEQQQRDQYKQHGQHRRQRAVGRGQKRIEVPGKRIDPAANAKKDAAEIP